MIRQTYSLCGVTVDLRCSESRQGANIDGLWRRLFVLNGTDAGSPAPSLHLEFTRQGSMREPSHAQKVFESSALRVLKTEEGFFLQCGGSSVDLQVSRGTGVGVLDDGFWRYPLQDQREFFLLTLLMLARRHALYGLHANALSRDDSGCLIVGNSGAGKTTLTIALVKEGWGYLSDDAVMLRKSGDGIQALAFRGGFSLTPQATTQFPELASSELRGHLKNGKRSVDIESVYPGRFTSRCKPGLILFPKVDHRRRSQLVPLDELRALTLLIEQSPGIMTDKAFVGGQLGVLKLLVEQANSYQILAGTDVFEEPSAVSRLVLDAQAG